MARPRQARSEVFHRPNRGRAGRQGPGALRFTPCANMSARTHGPRLPRGNEACRSRIVPAVGSLQSLGRARRKSAGFPGVPRAVFIGLLRKEPRKSSASPVVRRDLPTRTRPACSPLTGARPGRQGPPRQRRRREALCGLDRRALPAHLRCKENSPATAPRPASGDADQTPLGNGAGYLQAYSPIGIKSSGKARRGGGAAD